MAEGNSAPEEETKPQIPQGNDKDKYEGMRVQDTPEYIRKLSPPTPEEEARQIELETKRIRLETAKLEHEEVKQRIEQQKQPSVAPQPEVTTPPVQPQVGLPGVGPDLITGPAAGRLLETLPKTADFTSWEFWLRDQLASIENIGVEVAGGTFGSLQQIIQLYSPLDIKDKGKLLKELNARVTLYNGALFLQRGYLEQFVSAMSVPIEIFETISKVEGFDVAKRYFDQRLVEIFSAPDEFKNEGYDENGNQIEIKREEKLNLVKDIEWYREQARKEVYTYLEGLSQTDPNYKKSLSLKIGDERAKAIKDQADTAVSLVEKILRVTGVAAECDVPEFWDRDISERNIKKGDVRIPYKKMFVKRDGVVTQVFVEKKEVNGVEKEVPGTVVVNGRKEDEVIEEELGKLNTQQEKDEFLNQHVKKFVENRSGIKKGTGDFALWRDMYMYPYAEWFGAGRGKPEVRRYVKTGMVSLLTNKSISEKPLAEGETQSDLLLKAARGEATSRKPGDYGLGILIQGVTEKRWRDVDWINAWLAVLKNMDDTRAQLEDQKGFLYVPTEDDVVKLASEGYTYFKDKIDERRSIFGDLYHGVLEFNMSVDTVKKYYGRRIKPWSTEIRDMVLERAIRENNLSSEQVELEKRRLQVSGRRKLNEFWEMHLLLPLEAAIPKAVEKFFAGLSRIFK